MFLIDLKKTIDTNDHDLLFQICYWYLEMVIINSFKSYLSNGSFLVNLEKNFFQFFCGVHQGSSLRPLLFLICVNEMSQAVKCDLFRYADDSRLVC